MLIDHSPNRAWKTNRFVKESYSVDINCVFLFFCFLHVGCGPVIANTLRSPGYPNDYPNNTDCISRVPIPQGMVINITIDELYLEDSISCE